MDWKQFRIVVDIVQKIPRFVNANLRGPADSFLYSLWKPSRPPFFFR